MTKKIDSLIHGLLHCKEAQVIAYQRCLINNVYDIYCNEQKGEFSSFKLALMKAEEKLAQAMDALKNAIDSNESENVHVSKD